ncbi:glycosyl hydrolase [Alloscardovia macacae]|uniref:Exo-alpha-(1->6)-L-arabinopyranosidase n=1 Tax=Alloscardovia macacae TaxID=1160091 RepID=A0A1Y2SXN3_9BIFI|nr:exo-alpha-(1->6)-L-arabinopyranosidase [Alloscardovia macacae]OTA26264.1 glycosyl hydrolase [Alloscardovia macacae]OTA28926.1 glycosyl hydrolase [Alloscardovia macacae]
MVNVHDLTVEEKASLTSGGDAWHFQSVERLGVPGYMLTDGPHGLRKEKSETAALDMKNTVPATCFPPAAGMSSSWNPDLVREVGVAMGEECIQEDVAVILGPGVNIKRNPLGGRSFEYWSEDPFLAGHEAVGIVEGVQSQGIGTSLKHFAANNQETDRLRIDARISERALREIYLPAFEHIVKTAQPWTIMCAYNQLNGVFGSENRWLLTDVLRDEWGFEGIVMSDWGAVHDRAASLNAGLNLEMPPSYTDDEIVVAVKDGRVSEEQLDRMAQGMLDLVEKAREAMEREGFVFDKDVHHRIARRAAQESIVMLKNEDGLLPLASGDGAEGSEGTRVAVIGEFARTPRYQGGGSSHINPTKMTSLLDALEERGANFTFAPGFTLDRSEQTDELTAEALSAAKAADVVVFAMGLPEEEESEGFDRTHLDMPAKQLELLAAVSEVNENVVAVLSNGSAVQMNPWQENAKAVLETWLLGQAGGSAVADILFGDANPSGKLAQSFPLDIKDDPSMVNWPGGDRVVDYGEGIFVGYRYYDTFDVDVAYPFGYGLSYSTFTVSDVAVEATGSMSARVSATVTNTSDVDGAEVVQVYVNPADTTPVQRPVHELKGFQKVFVKAGESVRVSIDLDDRAFAYWSEKDGGWRVVAGEYGVEVATCSRDIVSRETVSLAGDDFYAELNEWSNYGEFKADKWGALAVQHMLEKGATGELPAIPQDNLGVQLFLETMPINSMPVLFGKEGHRLTQFLLEDYAAERAKA